GRENFAETPFQLLFINRLAKVTKNPIVQDASSVNLIGVSSDEDCRNRAPCFNEMLVELDPGHRRHMDISDQASRFTKTRRCEEIGCRRKSLDGVAQRPHEPSHRVAKELIIFND